MTIYQTPDLSLEESPVPLRTLVYYRRRLRQELHELVLRVFFHQAEAAKFTKKRFAKRLAKDPAQITRWLGAPGNWTLDTFSDLLVGMAIDPRRAVAFLADQLEAELKPEGEVPAIAIPDASKDAQPHHEFWNYHETKLPPWVAKTSPQPSRLSGLSGWK